MSTLSWQYGYVQTAVEYLVDGASSLHDRLFNAWKTLDRPLHEDKFPAEIQPVFKNIVENLHRLSNGDTADRDEEAEAARQVLRFYRYLTEHQAVSDPTRRLKPDDIQAKRIGPGVLEIGPDGISEP